MKTFAQEALKNTYADLDKEIPDLFPYKEDNPLIAGLADAFPHQKIEIADSIKGYYKKIGEGSYCPVWHKL